MDNNPLTYVLTSAKLDATGQRWVASLANYNFKIFYHCGRSNVNADSLSRIPWEVTQEDHTQMGPIVKSLMLATQTAIRVPHLPNAVIAAKELIVRTDFQLTKAQWREEQKTDLSISKVVELIHSKKLASYECQKTDSNDLKGLMRQRKDLFLESGLLYRKAYFKTTNKLIHQFVMPPQFANAL